MKNVFNKIICNDFSNLNNLISHNHVNLSIVLPSYQNTKNSDYAVFLKNLLKQLSIVTKPDGICCLILEDEIDPNTDTMSMKSTRSILEILDSKDESSDWILDDKIIWVKSPKDKVESLNPMESGTMISFEDTPFSTIYVLIKKDSNLEPVSILDRLWSLRISEAKKTEMSDFVWFIQPSSDKGYHDHIPKEMVIRLIMLFSEENDLIIDPFAGDGIVALAAKILKRQYICIEKNSEKIKKAKKRIEVDFTT